MHNLSLSFPKTYFKTSLIVIDASIYDQNIEVSNKLLDVKLPGFSTSTLVNLGDGVQNSTKALSMGDLGYADFSNFPDGIYCFRFSVAPNTQVNKKFDFLRTTLFDIEYAEFLTSLKFDNEGCSCKNSKHLIDSLREIGLMVEAAKATIDIGHSPYRALELFECAKKLLSQLKTDC